MFDDFDDIQIEDLIPEEYERAIMDDDYCWYLEDFYNEREENEIY